MRFRAPAEITLRRAQVILIAAGLVPTIFTTATAVVLMALGSSSISIVAGLLVLGFAASTITAAILVGGKAAQAAVTELVEVLASWPGARLRVIGREGARK